MKEDALKQEARAFDQQIEECLEAGYIPDLRKARECKYFYNNTWRHPDYVKLDFVEQFDLIRNAVHKLAPPASEPVRVLEVGCGPGHMSFEMARHGFDVTGIDLSQSGKSQSFNDNEAGYADMIGVFQQYFNELNFQERYAFFHELIGGLRFQDSKNTQLAGYLRDADKELCRLGVLQPTEFFCVGQKSG